MKATMYKLFVAIERGDYDTVKTSLDDTSVCNAINRYRSRSNQTALILATIHNQTRIAILLVNKGADVDIGMPDTNSTPLLVAIYLKNIVLARIFLQRRADINILNEDGYTALIAAAQEGHTDIVELILKRDVDVNQARPTDGCTALIAATQAGHVKIVRLLLDAGANIDQCAQYDMTALMCASSQGHDDIVKLLIMKNADVEAVTIDGFTARDFAWNHKKDTVVAMIDKKREEIEAISNKKQENTNKYKAICALISRQEDSVVIKLIEDEQKQADASASTSENYPVLTVACQCGRLNIVQYLLSQGRDINQRSIQGSTALSAAASNGHYDVVQWLLDNGAETHHTNGDGYTALMMAAKNGHGSIVQLLLDRGAELNQEGLDGHTALTLAARGARRAVVQLLLERGAKMTRTATDDNCHYLQVLWFIWMHDILQAAPARYDHEIRDLAKVSVLFLQAGIVASQQFFSWIKDDRMRQVVESTAKKYMESSMTDHPETLRAEVGDRLTTSCN